MTLDNKFVEESEIRSRLYIGKSADSAKQEVCDDVSKKGSTKAQATESYDREAILYKLANLADFDAIKYVTKTEILRKNAVSEDSLETSEPRNTNQKDTDDENPRSRVERLRKALQAVPDSLLHIITGLGRPGDCGRPSDLKPDWLDEEKLRRGQKFAQEYMFPVLYAEIIAGFAVFSFEDSLKPLIITGKSISPFGSFKRYLSLALRFRNWFTRDLWSEESEAWKDMKAVKMMHAAIRRRLVATTNEEIDIIAEISNPWCPAREILLKDFSEACEAPAIGQCPYMIEKNDPDRPKGMNQTDMALAQWTPVGLLLSYPEYFGVHYATDEDLEAYGHLWRVIGYQMGIEDEFNFCRGTLEDIRHRSRDFVETWIKPNLRVITPEWEHAMRCLISGVSAIIPILSYEIVLLCLTEVLGLHMPRLYASLSYKDWITHNLIRSFLNHGVKLPVLLRLSNSVVNYALDRAANFTPKELKAVETGLSKYPESKAKLGS